MSFIIKNVRDHKILVGDTVLNPGEQLTGQVLTDAINDAADRGDITVHDASVSVSELKSDSDAFKPFHTGDKAIDG